MQAELQSFDLTAVAAAWRRFAPVLHVDDAESLASCTNLPITEKEGQDLARSLATEGYVQRDPPDWGLPIAAMAEVIGSLNRHGLPAALAFVYDEFWLLFQRLHPAIRAMLGHDFAMLPNFWAWHVDPATGGGGWAPHRDLGRAALFADRTPKAISVWVPLSDATPLNGCMYLVPADRDPTYGTEDEQSLRFRLTDIRALPARAGSVLAWTQAVIHWGAQSAPPAAGRPSAPRISLSCEFQRTDVTEFRPGLLDPLRPPDFARRLRLIGSLMLHYRHMHTLTPAMETLATRLCQGAAGAAPVRSAHDDVLILASTGSV